MDMTGETIIPAPREAVWRALNDPEILRQAIPGCESVDKVSDTEFTAKVVAKVGPVKASFTGRVTLTDLDPPNGYRISGEGKGGAAGFAKGGAEVRLTDTPEGTCLSYSVDAQVGGKLAQIGSRLIDATARSLSNEFFARFAALVTAGPEPMPVVAEPSEGPGQVTADPPIDGIRDVTHEAVAGDRLAPAPPTADPVRVPDEAAAMDAAVRQTRGLPPWVWIGGVVLLVALVLALAG